MKLLIVFVALFISANCVPITRPAVRPGVSESKPLVQIILNIAKSSDVSVENPAVPEELPVHPVLPIAPLPPSGIVPIPVEPELPIIISPIPIPPIGINPIPIEPELPIIISPMPIVPHPPQTLPGQVPQRPTTWKELLELLKQQYGSHGAVQPIAPVPISPIMPIPAPVPDDLTMPSLPIQNKPTSWKELLEQLKEIYGTPAVVHPIAPAPISPVQPIPAPIPVIPVKPAPEVVKPVTFAELFAQLKEQYGKPALT